MLRLAAIPRMWTLGRECRHAVPRSLSSPKAKLAHAIVLALMPAPALAQFYPPLKRDPYATTHIDPLPGGGWEIYSSDQTSRRLSAVVHSLHLPSGSALGTGVAKCLCDKG